LGGVLEAAFAALLRWELLPPPGQIVTGWGFLFSGCQARGWW